MARRGPGQRARHGVLAHGGAHERHGRGMGRGLLCVSSSGAGTGCFSEVRHDELARCVRLERESDMGCMVGWQVACHCQNGQRSRGGRGMARCRDGAGTLWVTKDDQCQVNITV